MRVINHVNVLKLRRIYSDDKYIHLVTDLAKSDLNAVLQKGSLLEEQAARILHKPLIERDSPQRRATLEYTGGK